MCIVTLANTVPLHRYLTVLMMPFNFKREQLDYDLVVGADTVVTPIYDPHCTNGDVTLGCEPIAIVSAEKLLDYNAGPAETTKIAQALMGHDKISQYVIGEILIITVLR
jgi:hypothetical protein